MLEKLLNFTFHASLIILCKQYIKVILNKQMEIRMINFIILFATLNSLYFYLSWPTL